MEIAELYEVFKASTGICTDTRKLKAGQIYFALKGGNFNGNLFANKAIDGGAVLAIVDEPVADHVKIIQVDDSLKCLQELANYHRNQLSIPFLGITGSNGKTTTKEFIAAVLSKKYKVHATKGNFNNHIGVPLTLLEIDRSAEFAIIEMGANHIGEIEELCKIADPDFGIITNIGLAHIEGFGSAEGVARGKSELYLHVLKKGGQVFFNQQDEKLVRMSSRFSEPISYLGESSYCSPRLLEASPFVVFDYADTRVVTNTVGDYNFNNMAAAMCIGKYFGVTDKEVIAAVSSYISDNNRSEIRDTGKNKVILDAYNANPSSMEASLNNFKMMNADQKVIILGDMYELGDMSVMEHQRIADLAAQMEAELLLVGELFSKVAIENGSVFASKELVENYLNEVSLSGKTVLLKGSRGMKLESLLNLL